MNQSSSSSFSLAQEPFSVNAYLYLYLYLWAWLSVTFYYHSKIVRSLYGDTFYSGLESITGMLLSRTSWRLFHQTGPNVPIVVQFVGDWDCDCEWDWDWSHHIQGEHDMVKLFIKAH